MEKRMISIDWLEVFGWVRSGDLANPDFYKETPSSDFYLKDTGIMSRSFEHITEVYSRVGGQTKLPVASIRWKPRSSMLNQRLCLVKLHNRVLYCEKYVSILYGIVDWLGIAIKGITRLDVCCDVNVFKGGRKPSRFLKDFAFIDQNNSKYIYLVGAKSFRVFASKNPTSNTAISGIEFGSGKSDKRAYIYDKTRELAEVKDKPWIREAWERNGLVSDSSTHVYRCEISMKSEAMQVLNFNTGELFKLSPHFLESQGKVEQLFFIYAAKMFDFRIKGNATRLRDYKRLELFTIDGEISCKPKKVNTFADTGRTEKVVVNCLSKHMYRYSDLSEEYRRALYQSIQFLSVVANLKMRKVELAKETQYLEAFKGTEFISSGTIDYLAFVHALSTVKYDISGKWYNEYLCSNDVEGNSLPNDSLEMYWQYCHYMEGVNPIPYIV